MKALKIILVDLLLFFFCLSLAHAGGVGQQFDVKGYKIHTFCDQESGRIEVSGRISGGERCKNLRIELFLVSEKGRRGHVITVADDVGGAGLRMFKGRDNVSGINNEWKFTSVFVDCVSGENIETADRSDQKKKHKAGSNTSTSGRQSRKYNRKSRAKPASSEKPLKIYEDDKGVIHIEQ